MSLISTCDSVYECVSVEFASVLEYLSNKVAELHAVGSGFNSWTGYLYALTCYSFFFINQWKPFSIFIRVRTAYLSSVIMISLEAKYT